MLSEATLQLQVLGAGGTGLRFAGRSFCAQMGARGAPRSRVLHFARSVALSGHAFPPPPGWWRRSPLRFRMAEEAADSDSLRVTCLVIVCVRSVHAHLR